LTLALDSGNFGITVKRRRGRIREQSPRLTQGLGFGPQTNRRRNLHATGARTTTLIEAGLRGIQAIARVVGILFGCPTFTLDCDLLATVFLFGALGSVLALGFGEATKLFHAGTVTFSSGTPASTKHREEVGATRGQHAGTEFTDALEGLAFHVAGHALAQHIENRKLALRLGCGKAFAVCGLKLFERVGHFRGFVRLGRRTSCCGPTTGGFILGDLKR
jgi:hypothetical protein